MHVLEGTDGRFSPDDFSAKVTHVVGILSGETYNATFEAIGTFGLDDLRLVRGNSGQCSWSLKGEVKHVLVRPVRV